ncbi:hypothetical protein ACFL4G_11675 [Thermodesulfobacteriota bacterium]
MLKRVVLVLIILALAATGFTGPARADESFFARSLHHTGEGMRYWYEEQGGFMEVTGIPYAELSCKGCHAESCDTCHAAKEGEFLTFSAEKAGKMETCFQCHGREAKSIQLDTKAGTEDVHFASGMGCMDCHSAQDVHGDGNFYQSMRAPGAMNLRCRDCHLADGSGEAPYGAATHAHKVHKGKLNCSACHVRNTMACYNCHFDSALKTGKKGNFIPMKSWLLLINHEDQVTAASVQTLVYQDKKFLAYIPYHTHSVMSPGRACDACHANKAVELIKKGRKVPVVAFADGEVRPWAGVVPVIPEGIEFAYFNKTAEGIWVPVENDDPATVQFAAYGTALTEKQIKKLFIKRK